MAVYIKSLSGVAVNTGKKYKLTIKTVDKNNSGWRPKTKEMFVYTKHSAPVVTAKYVYHILDEINSRNTVDVSLQLNLSFYKIGQLYNISIESANSNYSVKPDTKVLHSNLVSTKDNYAIETKVLQTFEKEVNVGTQLYFVIKIYDDINTMRVVNYTATVPALDINGYVLSYTFTGSDIFTCTNDIESEKIIISLPETIKERLKLLPSNYKFGYTISLTDFSIYGGWTPIINTGYNVSFSYTIRTPEIYTKNDTIISFDKSMIPGECFVLYISGNGFTLGISKLNIDSNTYILNSQIHTFTNIPKLIFNAYKPFFKIKRCRPSTDYGVDVYAENTNGMVVYTSSVYYNYNHYEYRYGTGYTTCPTTFKVYVNDVYIKSIQVVEYLGSPNTSWVNQISFHIHASEYTFIKGVSYTIQCYVHMFQTTASDLSAIAYNYEKSSSGQYYTTHTFTGSDRNKLCDSITFKMDDIPSLELSNIQLIENKVSAGLKCSFDSNIVLNDDYRIVISHATYLYGYVYSDDFISGYGYGETEYPIVNNTFAFNEGHIRQYQNDIFFKIINIKNTTPIKPSLTTNGYSYAKYTLLCNVLPRVSKIAPSVTYTDVKSDRFTARCVGASNNPCTMHIYLTKSVHDDNTGTGQSVISTLIKENAPLDDTIVVTGLESSAIYNIAIKYIPNDLNSFDYSTVLISPTYITTKLFSLNSITDLTCTINDRSSLTLNWLNIPVDTNKLYYCEKTFRPNGEFTYKYSLNLIGKDLKFKYLLYLNDKVVAEIPYGVNTYTLEDLLHSVDYTFKLKLYSTYNSEMPSELSSVINVNINPITYSPFTKFKQLEKLTITFDAEDLKLENAESTIGTGFNYSQFRVSYKKIETDLYTAGIDCKVKIYGPINYNPDLLYYDNATSKVSVPDLESYPVSILGISEFYKDYVVKLPENESKWEAALFVIHVVDNNSICAAADPLFYVFPMKFIHNGSNGTLINGYNFNKNNLTDSQLKVDTLLYFNRDFLYRNGCIPLGSQSYKVNNDFVYKTTMELYKLYNSYHGYGSFKLSKDHVYVSENSNYKLFSKILNKKYYPINYKELVANMPNMYVTPGSNCVVNFKTNTIELTLNKALYYNKTYSDAVYGVTRVFYGYRISYRDSNNVTQYQLFDQNSAGFIVIDKTVIKPNTEILVDIVLKYDPHPDLYDYLFKFTYTDDTDEYKYNMLSQVSAVRTYSNNPYNNLINNETYNLTLTHEFGSYRYFTKQNITPFHYLKSYYNSNIILKQDKTMWVNGDNFYNQLGIDTNRDSLKTLTKIGLDNDWNKVDTTNHTLLLKDNGTLWGCGSNIYGQLNRNVSSNYISKFTKTKIDDIVTFSCSDIHVLIIRSDGTLWSCGSNSNGQLGDGTKIDSDKFIKVGAKTNWVTVETAYSNSFAIDSEGALYAWGWNGYYNLGLGFTTADVVTPTKLSGVWSTVKCNSTHAFAINSVGQLFSWGRGTSTEHQNGTSANIYTPVEISPGQTWSNVFVFGHTTYAITTTGELWGCGINTQNSLMQSTNGIHYTFRKITDIVGWTTIIDSNTNKLGIMADKSVYGWGTNSSYELGLGNNVDKTSAVLLNMGTDYTKFTSYGGTLFIKTDGTLWGFGANLSGTLGTGNTTAVQVPTQIGTDNDWKDISIRYFGASLQTYAIKTDGTMWVWGAGTGVTYTPQQYLAETNWVSFTTNKTSLTFNVAIKTDNFKYLLTGGSQDYLKWGYYDINLINNVTKLSDDIDWVKIKCLANSTVALKTNGTIWSCGRNDLGQLGVGDNVDKTSFTQVGTDSDWVDIDCGLEFIIAKKTDGSYWGWGYNGKYQLGLGSGVSGNKNTPFIIANSGVWTKVSCGLEHAVAIKSNGTIWGWGNGSSKQFGMAVTYYYAPTQLGTDTDWVDVYGRINSTFVVKNNGSIYHCGTITPVTTSVLTKIVSASGITEIFSSSNYNLLKTTNGDTYFNGVLYLKDHLNITRKLNNTIRPTNTVWKAIYADPITPGVYIVDNNNLGYYIGDGLNYRLGTSQSYLTKPTKAEVLYNFDEISIGEKHTLGIKGTELWVRGVNTAGQLGTGSTSTKTTPFKIDNFYCKKVYSQGMLSIAMKLDNTLWVSGSNTLNNGIGLGATNSVNVFTQINADTDWVTVVNTGTVVVAIKTNGTMWVFGAYAYNDAAGSVTDYRVFTQINTDTDWSDVKYGKNFLIAKKTNGTLWGIGVNDFGQLGINNLIKVTVFTQLLSDTDWVGFDCGNQHTIAYKANGDVYGTGSLSTYDNVASVYSSWKFLYNIPNLKSIKCSGSSTFVLLDTGELYNFGGMQTNDYSCTRLVDDTYIIPRYISKYVITCLETGVVTTQEPYADYYSANVNTYFNSNANTVYIASKINGLIPNKNYNIKIYKILDGMYMYNPKFPYGFNVHYKFDGEQKVLDEYEELNYFNAYLDLSNFNYSTDLLNAFKINSYNTVIDGSGKRYFSLLNVNDVRRNLGTTTITEYVKEGNLGSRNGHENTGLLTDYLAYDNKVKLKFKNFSMLIDNIDAFDVLTDSINGYNGSLSFSYSSVEEYISILKLFDLSKNLILSGDAIEVTKEIPFMNFKEKYSIVDVANKITYNVSGINIAEPYFITKYKVGYDYIFKFFSSTANSQIKLIDDITPENISYTLTYNNDFIKTLTTKIVPTKTLVLKYYNSVKVDDTTFIDEPDKDDIEIITDDVYIPILDSGQNSFISIFNNNTNDKFLLYVSNFTTLQNYITNLNNSNYLADFKYFDIYVNKIIDNVVTESTVYSDIDLKNIIALEIPHDIEPYAEYKIFIYIKDFKNNYKHSTGFVESNTNQTLSINNYEVLPVITPTFTYNSATFNLTISWNPIVLTGYSRLTTYSYALYVCTDMNDLNVYTKYTVSNATFSQVIGNVYPTTHYKAIVCIEGTSSYNKTSYYFNKDSMLDILIPLGPKITFNGQGTETVLSTLTPVYSDYTPETYTFNFPTITGISPVSVYAVNIYFKVYFEDVLIYTKTILGSNSSFNLNSTIIPTVYNYIPGKNTYSLKYRFESDYYENSDYVTKDITFLVLPDPIISSHSFPAGDITRFNLNMLINGTTNFNKVIVEVESLDETKPLHLIQYNDNYNQNLNFSFSAFGSTYPNTYNALYNTLYEGVSYKFSIGKHNSSPSRYIGNRVSIIDTVPYPVVKPNMFYYNVGLSNLTVTLALRNIYYEYPFRRSFIVIKIFINDVLYTTDNTNSPLNGGGQTSYSIDYNELFKIGNNIIRVEVEDTNNLFTKTISEYIMEDFNFPYSSLMTETNTNGFFNLYMSDVKHNEVTLKWTKPDFNKLKNDFLSFHMNYINVASSVSDSIAAKLTENTLGYQIYLANSDGMIYDSTLFENDLYTLVGSCLYNQTSFVIEDLKPDTKYMVFVKCYDINGIINFDFLNNDNYDRLYYSWYVNRLNIQTKKENETSDILLTDLNIAVYSFENNFKKHDTPTESDTSTMMNKQVLTTFELSSVVADKIAKEFRHSDYWWNSWNMFKSPALVVKDNVRILNEESLKTGAYYNYNHLIPNLDIYSIAKKKMNLLENLYNLSYEDYTVSASLISFDMEYSSFYLIPIYNNAASEAKFRRPFGYFNTFRTTWNPTVLDDSYANYDSYKKPRWANAFLDEFYYDEDYFYLETYLLSNYYEGYIQRDDKDFELHIRIDNEIYKVFDMKTYAELNKNPDLTIQQLNPVTNLTSTIKEGRISFNWNKNNTDDTYYNIYINDKLICTVQKEMYTYIYERFDCIPRIYLDFANGYLNGYRYTTFDYKTSILNYNKLFKYGVSTKVSVEAVDFDGVKKSNKTSITITPPYNNTDIMDIDSYMCKYCDATTREPTVIYDLFMYDNDVLFFNISDHNQLVTAENIQYIVKIDDVLINTVNTDDLLYYYEINYDNSITTHKSTFLDVYNSVIHGAL